jgi:hypothetical protein
MRDLIPFLFTSSTAPTQWLDITITIAQEKFSDAIINTYKVAPASELSKSHTNTLEE